MPIHKKLKVVRQHTDSYAYHIDFSHPTRHRPKISGATNQEETNKISY